MNYKISDSLNMPVKTSEKKAKLHKHIQEFIETPIITQYELDVLFDDGILIAGPSGISVDWKKFSEMDKNYYGNDVISNHCVDYLKHINILSPNYRGNYSIHCDGGILCNPRFHLIPAFFTSERDARLYRDAIADGAMYSVWIAKGC